MENIQTAPLVTYMMRVWVGPTMVDTIADKMIAAGIQVETRGTEHVYFLMSTTDGSFFTPELNARLKFLTTLQLKHGTKFGFGVRDIHILRRVALEPAPIRPEELANG